MSSASDIEGVSPASIRVENHSDANTGETRRILRERARELARPLDTSDELQELHDVLMFTLSGDRYGVETSFVTDVGPLRDLTLLPGAPHFVHGIINHRGRILPVLDFRSLLELPVQGPTEEPHVVTVEAAGMAFGILVGIVEGVVQVPAGEIAADTVSGLHNPWFLGVTGDMAVVLDLAAVARDPRILVNDAGS